MFCLRSKTAAAVTVAVWIVSLSSCVATTFQQHPVFMECIAEPSTCLNLVITDQALTGSIPTEVGLFTNLVWIELRPVLQDVEDAVQVNKLTGILPTELGQLSALTMLEIQSEGKENQLRGSIPSQLGYLTNLVHLAITNRLTDSYGLTGTIPSQLAQLTKLTYLDFQKNSLAGTIPSEIGSLTLVAELNLRARLDGGGLHGTIPTEMGMMQSLQKLVLDNNQLTGGLPSQLGNLPLTDLSVTHNFGLSGLIPGVFWDLQGPTPARLVLGFTQLCGAIPPTARSSVSPGNCPDGVSSGFCLP
eukprot:CAMPEP_0118928728 /NCGR_PEP_ID=MMETSP1169-20130426/5915_1 /TAXON_ID=36882 /ORGANISM="Pyramimonas obovata, Strain CCMP722" /LENGTH=301 /DNA_ID=CAMNT_0006870773 /DNA_START=87 /DNA_END=989 /DNA_ORIENTATION=-